MSMAELTVNYRTIADKELTFAARGRRGMEKDDALPCCVIGSYSCTAA